MRSFGKLALIIFAAFLGGCFPYPLQETPRVSGTVISSVTKRPIEGASVYFERFQTEPVHTDRQGHFDIPVISRVQIAVVGYDRFNAERHLVIEAPGYRIARFDANIWVVRHSGPFALTPK